jgi:hypothetical protein
MLAAVIPLGLLKFEARCKRCLTPQEAQRLHELEGIIEEGFESFIKVGLAFAEVRFHKLHRATHARFDSVEVVQNITTAFPQDAPLLAQTSEHTLRPLSRLEPDLQVVTWELIRHLEERPSGTTVEQVVSTIRNAIRSGWQERSAPTPINGKNGATHHRTTRQSDQLATLSRWVNRVTSWDPVMIAQADDELTLKRHLKAARRLRRFCEAI